MQLGPLIDEVTGTARQLAEQNKNRLLNEVQEDLGTLSVDPMRLRQIPQPVKQCLQVHQGGRGSAARAQVKQRRPLD